MHRRPSLRRALAPALFAALAACAGTASAPTVAPSGSPQAEITALLQASTDEWNRGSLEGFLVPYLDAPGTTFVGSKGLLRGKAAIADQYRSSWFSGGVPKERLSFRDIEVRPLGPGHALAVGRWVVNDRATGAETGAGFFSLTLQRTPEGWRIVHDHSS